MKPYHLEIKDGETLIYAIDSDIPFQAFSVGDTISFDLQYLGVITKVHHFVKDSSRDKINMHGITLTVKSEV